MEDKNDEKRSSPPTIRSLADNSTHRLAGFLTRQSERLTQRQKKTVVLLFGLLAACASIALVTSPLFQNESHQPRRQVTKRVNIPALHHPGDQPKQERWSHQSSALKALDSLYARDPKRFMQMIERRLIKMDSSQSKR